MARYAPLRCRPHCVSSVGGFGRGVRGLVVPALRRPRSHRANPPVDGLAVLERVLAATHQDVDQAQAAAQEKAAAADAAGKQRSPFKRDLVFAMHFAKHVGREIVAGLEPDFPGTKSGENPSRAVRGMKRVDVNYSTPEAGLGLAISFKSVHFGERGGGDVRFTHNMKRNDEELRVEATAHHLRQPYAVMVAMLFLPLQSCHDGAKSSFASWVEYLWALKGRVQPEDPPDRFELVFVALYARDGSAFGFYEVGGAAPCPRKGTPKLLTLAETLARIKTAYDRRNGLDFFFEGEQPE